MRAKMAQLRNRHVTRPPARFSPYADAQGNPPLLP
jgi:hypothetical protein